MQKPPKPCQREQRAPSTLKATSSDTDFEEETIARPQRKRTKPLLITTGDIVA
ncbi:hypothetical protein DPMN_083620 [Dreissena polymorpha]|uniref:Uncharacterized protein n=1 Tax=Dreissena polymorpha TaxID=45954 RepID=A0A9D4BBA0_DREPO|nr:hypothetical protein DPMN_083620 [Dreissena polymorpha]